MSFLDEFANAKMLGRWAEPLLLQLRARRERARQVLARQAELLAQLEASISEPQTAPQGVDVTQFRLWMNDFSEQQMIWQQRQDDNWQRQLSMLDMLAEQIEELNSSVHHESGPPAPAKPTPAPAAPASNWEQAKQRLLAELDANEAEPPKEEPAKATGKSRRAWQQMIADKDAEIAQLRLKLEQAASHAPSIVMPESVQHDEMVAMERENLRRLQTEWQEKLRRAEIEISLERAKLARERQQMEEKMQTTPGNSNSGSPGPAEEASKAPRSRWKARLGLLDE